VTGPLAVFGVLVLVFVVWRFRVVNREMKQRAACWDGNHLV
jgi:hypothetical protein